MDLNERYHNHRMFVVVQLFFRLFFLFVLFANKTVRGLCPGVFVKREVVLRWCGRICRYAADILRTQVHVRAREAIFSRRAKRAARIGYVISRSELAGAGSWLSKCGVGEEPLRGASRPDDSLDVFVRGTNDNLEKAAVRVKGQAVDRSTRD